MKGMSSADREAGVTTIGWGARWLPGQKRLLRRAAKWADEILDDLDPSAPVAATTRDAVSVGPPTQEPMATDHGPTASVGVPAEHRESTDPGRPRKPEERATGGWGHRNAFDGGAFGVGYEPRALEGALYRDSLFHPTVAPELLPELAVEPFITGSAQTVTDALRAAWAFDPDARTPRGRDVPGHSYWRGPHYPEMSSSRHWWLMQSFGRLSEATSSRQLIALRHLGDPAASVVGDAIIRVASAGSEPAVFSVIVVRETPQSSGERPHQFGQSLSPDLRSSSTD